jgi:hypothetical protein
MSAAMDALRGALRAGVQVSVDGGDLLLEAAGEPPSSVVGAISRHKAAVVALLRATGERKLTTKAATIERVADSDSLPEFLDRVKNPRPGDLPTYSWVNCYPSGGKMKH